VFLTLGFCPSGCLWKPYIHQAGQRTVYISHLNTAHIRIRSGLQIYRSSFSLLPTFERRQKWDSFDIPQAVLRPSWRHYISRLSYHTHFSPRFCRSDKTRIPPPETQPEDTRLTREFLPHPNVTTPNDSGPIYVSTSLRSELKQLI
jgi:hypothetical protein